VWRVRDGDVLKFTQVVQPHWVGPMPLVLLGLSGPMYHDFSGWWKPAAQKPVSAV
jgi:hypothetical protein